MSLLFIFSAGSTNSSDILEFQLQDPKKDELITKIKLYVLIKYRIRGRHNRNKRDKTKREKQVVLNISKLSPNDTHEEFVKSLKLQIRRTELQEISLPTWVVEDAYNGNYRLLRLKVVCHNCSNSDGPKLVMLFDRNSVQRRSDEKKKRQKTGARNRQKKSNRKNRKKYLKRRPYLKIRTKQNSLFRNQFGRNWDFFKI